MLKVSLVDDDPKRLNAIIEQIVRTYIAHNKSLITKEADKALEYVNNQLKEVKEQLNESEQQYKNFLNNKPNLDPSEVAKILAQQLASLKERKLDAEQKRIEMSERFTANHFIIIGIDKQLQSIKHEIHKIETQAKSLAFARQENDVLSSNVKKNLDLYMLLTNTSRRLQLAVASAISNVRFIDTPVESEKPVSLAVLKLISMGTFAGVLAGIVASLLKREQGLKSFLEIERFIGLPVVAVIPYSEAEKRCGKEIKRISHIKPLLVNVSPTDPAIESLRHFRNAVQYHMTKKSNNIMLITSAEAKVGKSFICGNLALLFGSGGKSVLLVDGDIREGTLHHYFGVEQHFGFSEALSQNGEVDELIHRNVAANVDFLSRGRVGGHSDLLLQQPFVKILEKISSRYDIVLFNSPPILASSDSIVLAAYAGSVYIVTRAGESTLSQIRASEKHLCASGIKATGVIFNAESLAPAKKMKKIQFGHQGLRAAYKMKEVSNRIAQ